MTWNEVLIYILKIVVGLVVSVGIPYLSSMIKAKVNNDQANKLVDRAADIVSQCVSYVNQIYVDALKKDGAFGEEEQQAAFNMAMSYIIVLLNDEAKKAVVEAFGDFDLWLRASIEKSVREQH